MFGLNMVHVNFSWFVIDLLYLKFILTHLLSSYKSNYQFSEDELNAITRKWMGLFSSFVCLPSCTISNFLFISYIILIYHNIGIILLLHLQPLICADG